jgi:ARG and Rhodanese-Phosphatase-superfamily-associated Protein domain
MQLAVRRAVPSAVFAFAVVASGCQRTTEERAKPPPRPAPTPLTDHAAVLPPIQVDSLSLTPIVRTGASPFDQDPDVLVLDEAFAKGLVTIREEASESVNTLTLTNKAAQPLFLLAGEVILGGKQDRIIGQNTIIAANTTQGVPVFCVEHGRWTEGATGTGFTTAKALAHGRLRGKASFEDQQEVWREVAAKNSERKTESATGTYRQIATQQASGDLAGRQDQRVNAALAKLDPAVRANMIGYAVALNGKVATVDLFDSPKLFHKLEHKLVASYLTEAIDVTADPRARPPAVADIQAFMADADKAVAETSYETNAAETTRSLGKAANKAIVELKSARRRYDKKAKALYKTYQAK